MLRKLEKLIELFLREPRKSAGGYAPVVEGDLGTLFAIVNILIAAKWEPDPDGDFPIDFKVIDRTIFEPDYYFKLPYFHKIEDNPVEVEDYISKAMANVKMAMESLDHALTLRRLDRREKGAQTP